MSICSPARSMQPLQRLSGQSARVARASPPPTGIHWVVNQFEVPCSKSLGRSFRIKFARSLLRSIGAYSACWSVVICCHFKLSWVWKSRVPPLFCEFNKHPFSVPRTRPAYGNCPGVICYSTSLTDGSAAFVPG